MKTDFDRVNEWLIQLFHDFMILEEQFLKDRETPDVTVKELQILTLIHVLGSCRATDIAKDQKLALSTITITLNRLEKKGYIRRTPSKTDRRVIFVGLEEKGNQICDDHREFFSDITDSLFDSIYDTSEDKLEGALDNLHHSLENLK